MASNIRSSNDLLTSDYLASLAGINARPAHTSRYMDGLVLPSAMTTGTGGSSYAPPPLAHHLYGTHLSVANSTPQYLADRLIGNLTNLNLNQLNSVGGGGSGGAGCVSYSTLNSMNNSSPITSDSINESLLRKENEIER